MDKKKKLETLEIKDKISDKRASIKYHQIKGAILSFKNREKNKKEYKVLNKWMDDFENKIIEGKEKEALKILDDINMASKGIENTSYSIESAFKKMIKEAFTY